jgi:chromosome segregation ATPase
MSYGRRVRGMKGEPLRRQKKETMKIRRFEKEEMQGIAEQFISEIDEQLVEKQRQEDELERRLKELEGKIYALVTTREPTPHEIQEHFVVPMNQEKEELEADLSKLKMEIFSLESAGDRIRYLMELRGYWDKGES